MLKHRFFVAIQTFIESLLCEVVLRHPKTYLMSFREVEKIHRLKVLISNCFLYRLKVTYKLKLTKSIFFTCYKSVAPPWLVIQNPPQWCIFIILVDIFFFYKYANNLKTISLLNKWYL